MATIVRAPLVVPYLSTTREWVGAPRACPQGQMPATVQMYGLVGQAPTKLWSPYYTYDSGAGVWLGWPRQSPIQQLPVTAKPIVPRQWFWGYIEPATWSPKAPLSNFNLLGGKVPTKRWTWDYFDQPNWSPTRLCNCTLLNTPVLVPFSNKGQQWTSETSPWQASFGFNSALNAVAPQSPLSAWKWRSDPSTTDVWQPLLSLNTSLLSTPVATPFVVQPRDLGLDRSDAWQLNYINNLVLQPQAAVPVVVNRKDLGLSSSDAWQANFSTNNVLLSQVTIPFLNRRDLGLSDTVPWQYKVSYNNLLLPQQVFAKPFFNYTWQYGDASSAPWTYQSQPYIGTIPYIPPPPVTDLHNLPFLVTVGRLRSF